MPCRPHVLVTATAAALTALGGINAVVSQETRANAAPQAGQRTGGRFAVTPLGDGPWEIDTERARIRVTVVTKSLDHPWGLAFVPNGDLLVTERPGRLRAVRAGVLDPAPLDGLPPRRAALIGGLLDTALHPDFEQNRLIYFSYSKPESEDSDLSTLAVSRARWDGGTAQSCASSRRINQMAMHDRHSATRA